MDFFCKYCGSKHEDSTYPKTCQSCENITWINPTPVAVIIQPVLDSSNKVGVLVGKRLNEPFVGGWNLIGGYIDTSDKNVIDAAVRELEEETGIITSQSSVNLFWSFSDGRHLLIFCENTSLLPISSLGYFRPNDECSEIRVAWEPEELCFGSHTTALKMWLDKNR